MGGRAQLALRRGEVGRRIVAHPPAQLSQYLVPAPAARRDEKDMPELVLIPAIFRVQRLERRRWGLHCMALLANRAVRCAATTLPDARMSLHRFEPLIIRQCVHRLYRDGQESSDGDEWLLRDDRMGPAPVGQACVQLVLEAVTQSPKT